MRFGSRATWRTNKDKHSTVGINSLSASKFANLKFIPSLPLLVPSILPLGPSLTMRSVALSAGLLSLALVVAAEEQKSIFEVMTRPL